MSGSDRKIFLGLVLFDVTLFFVDAIALLEAYGYNDGTFWALFLISIVGVIWYAMPGDDDGEEVSQEAQGQAHHEEAAEREERRD